MNNIIYHMLTSHSGRPPLESYTHRGQRQPKTQRTIERDFTSEEVKVRQGEFLESPLPGGYVISRIRQLLSSISLEI